MENRVGMMTSKTFGLLALICEPAGNEILEMIGQSSTVEAAEKRYVSPTVQVITWYTNLLKLGSK